MTSKVFLKDVLRSNNELHLCEDILKLAKRGGDKTIIFGWEKVHEFVEAISVANVQATDGGTAVPPPPFPMPDPLTTDSFKRVLLAYAQHGSACPLGTTCLPGEIDESCKAVVSLDRSNLDPWVVHVVGVGGADKVLLLANLFVPETSTKTLVNVVPPHPRYKLWLAL
ncbi:hypothetical protein PHYSODRAFT_256297 [Phytophthora sojae]|uniref:Uncharacterized protein n=1 Tax=Phytophthora sojae (strain P6497) TaxID=1094619 RepID=G4Z5M9_PHYSP|nr:hypothetical protein PHYSODRAFT_256297 [Phytophthora sojae]EGZ22343.1 hypothetical protein PHYSODRAFT_256297 [Phytophthora sojae]|eukprot:XP_009525060.1 hypothetical protein PHYSODRAFT_256297 [Phytophthora sojae]